MMKSENTLVWDYSKHSYREGNKVFNGDGTQVPGVYTDGICVYLERRKQDRRKENDNTEI